MTAREFWRGKRVFLTGHTGFKGSWLALMLTSWGAKLTGFALPPEPGALYEAACVADVMDHSIYGDLADRAALAAALSAAKADIVIHMAAQPLVRLSYDDPVGTYMTNVMGTVHLLDAVRGQPEVRAVLCITSDKAYENREWVWGYREDEPMGGHDPYSSSKGCAELVVSAFRRSYFSGKPVVSGKACHVASGRAGNVIGGGDWSLDRLVPDLIRSCRAGRETPIRNPGAVRPWQHVLEAVMGYALLCERLFATGGEAFADGWNFGPAPSAERTVEEVVEAVCRRWGGDARWRVEHSDFRHEANYLKLDSSKANRLLGWRPVWSFDETIEATVAWYRQHDAGRDMNAFTMSQIQDYLARAALPQESGR